MNKFNIAIDEAVVTSKYVTADRLPILYVSHEFDEEEGESWQFHCGNGDYSTEVLQLVRLSTILSLDPQICEVADLPDGHIATRSGIGQPWIYEKEV